MIDLGRRPVGLLDSGFGGLSVALAVARLLPSEHLVYAADCGGAPWGERTDDYVVARVDAITDFLLSHDVKAIVVACNTATAIAVEHMRERLSIPVIGIEPAVKPAVCSTRTGAVGVLATPATIASNRYRRLCAEVVASSEKHVRIFDAPAPGLMQCVEHGDFSTPETRALVEHFVAPLAAKGADRIVLGCTHYPFLSEEIARCAGPGVELIDPAPAVARQLERRLLERGALNPDAAAGTRRFFATDANAARERVLATLWARSGEAGVRLEPLVER